MHLMTVYSCFPLIYLLLMAEPLIKTSEREFSFRGLDATAPPTPALCTGVLDQLSLFEANTRSFVSFSF